MNSTDWRNWVGKVVVIGKTVFGMIGEVSKEYAVFSMLIGRSEQDNAFFFFPHCKVSDRFYIPLECDKQDNLCRATTFVDLAVNNSFFKHKVEWMKKLDGAEKLEFLKNE